MGKNDEPRDIAALDPADTRQYLHTRRGQHDAKKRLGETHGRTKTEFVEQTGINKTALGIVERLDRLSPEVRSDVFRSLDKLRGDMAGVWGQEETEDLFPERTPDEQKENFAAQRAEEKRRNQTLAADTVSLDDAKAARKARIKADLVSMRDKKLGDGPEAA
mgnify:CR=1 FL=1